MVCGRLGHLLVAEHQSPADGSPPRVFKKEQTNVPADPEETGRGKKEAPERLYAPEVPVFVEASKVTVYVLDATP
jgi:hypothetical protein